MRPGLGRISSVLRPALSVEPRRETPVVLGPVPARHPAEPAHHSRPCARHAVPPPMTPGHAAPPAAHEDHNNKGWWLGWWHGVAVTRCVLPTKLLYAGPG